MPSFFKASSLRLGVAADAIALVASRRGGREQSLLAELPLDAAHAYPVALAAGLKTLFEGAAQLQPPGRPGGGRRTALPAVVWRAGRALAIERRLATGAAFHRRRRAPQRAGRRAAWRRRARLAAGRDGAPVHRPLQSPPPRLDGRRLAGRGARWRADSRRVPGRRLVRRARARPGRSCGRG